MSLTGKDIAEIAKLLDASEFGALDLEMGSFRLRIRRGGSGRGWREEEGEDAPAAPPAPAPAAHAPAPAPAPASAAAANEVDVPAPLMGNFYSAPRPGEPPFVAVGDTVNPDSIIGIIEVMKLMNSVRAGVAGEVVAVLAENGSAVAEGQALVRVRV